MIELIYNEEEKYPVEEKVLRCPKKIKQMGNPGQYKKIFIEECVHTFLYQYSTGKEFETRMAILLGNSEKNGVERHLYIKGALPMRTLAEKQGVYFFSEWIWGELYQQCEEYFSELEIIGWFLSKPGSRVEKSVILEETHRTYFAGADKLLFMMEPLEADGGFFAFDKNCFEKQPGYYIYYEKNDLMEKFLADHVQESLERKESERIAVPTANFRKVLEEKKKEKQQRKKRIVSDGLKVVLVVSILGVAAFLGNQMHQIQKIKGELRGFTANLTTKEAFSDEVIIEEVAGNLELEQTTTVQPSAEPENMATVQPSPEPVKVSTVQPSPEPANVPTIQPTPEVTETPAPKQYTVQAGDSLAKISREHYGNAGMVEKICELNGIGDGDHIQIGETILLP